MKKKYIIAKLAKDDSWMNVYASDPKTTGLTISFSACYTRLGKDLSILSHYPDEKSAEIDCERLNKANPGGAYAVCVLIGSA